MVPVARLPLGLQGIRASVFSSSFKVTYLKAFHVKLLRKPDRRQEKKGQQDLKKIIFQNPKSPEKYFKQRKRKILKKIAQVIEKEN